MINEIIKDSLSGMFDSSLTSITRHTTFIQSSRTYNKRNTKYTKYTTIFLNHVRKNLILEKSSTIIAGQSSKLPFSSPRTVSERFRWEISLHRIDPATPTPCLLHFVPRPTVPTRLLATKSCRQRLDRPYSAQ